MKRRKFKWRHVNIVKENSLQIKWINMFKLAIKELLNVNFVKCQFLKRNMMIIYMVVEVERKNVIFVNNLFHSEVLIKLFYLKLFSRL